MHADKKICGVSTTFLSVPEPFFLQSLDRVYPKSFPTAFEWITEIGQSVSSYVSANKKSVSGSVDHSGTYTLALLQAVSLTTAPWLCHRRVIRVAPDMSATTNFSLSPTVFELRAKRRLNYALIQKFSITELLSCNRNSNMTQNEHVYAICCQREVGYDVISGQNADYRGQRLGKFWSC